MSRMSFWIFILCQFPMIMPCIKTFYSHIKYSLRAYTHYDISNSEYYMIVNRFFICQNTQDFNLYVNILIFLLYFQRFQWQVGECHHFWIIVRQWVTAEKHGWEKKSDSEYTGKQKSEEEDRVKRGEKSRRQVRRGKRGVIDGRRVEESEGHGKRN